jgi:hypothetical protein
MDDQIKKFINDYLDRMPSYSRVTMEDLSFYVHKETNFNRQAAYEIIREVIYSRTDFVVNRGRGCCKK